jgi:hypothetical protein
MSETVFIFHGRDSAAYAALETFCIRLGLEPYNFRQAVPSAGPRPTLDVITEGVAEAKAIILLLTPDEYMALDPARKLAEDSEGEIRGWAPRPNVLFEAGFAFGAARERTILTQFVYPGRHSVVLSNIAGINIIRLNEPGGQGKPNGASQLVSALQHLIPIDRERISNVLGMGGFSLPYTEKELTKVQWADPFVGPTIPPPPPLPLRMLIAASALGLGVGGTGVWAATASKQPKTSDKPAPWASAQSVPANSTSAHANPINCTPCPSSEQTSTPSPSAVVVSAQVLQRCENTLAQCNRDANQCKTEMAACKKQLGEGAKTTLAGGMTACPAGCEQHGATQCCPKDQHFLKCDYN